MKTELPKKRDNGRSGAVRQRRFPILSTLLVLDGFVLGGLVVLLMMNRLLNQHLIYAQSNIAAASTILDLLDDLLLYLVGYIGALLVLSSITAIAWIWLKTRSRLVRYGVVAVIVLIILAVGVVEVGRRGETAPLPPATPTPIAGSRNNDSGYACLPRLVERPWNQAALGSWSMVV